MSSVEAHGIIQHSVQDELRTDFGHRPIMNYRPLPNRGNTMPTTVFDTLESRTLLSIVPGPFQTLGTAVPLNSMDAASDANGNGIVVWQDGFRVKAQRLNVDGSPVGPVTDLNFGTRPTVAMEPDGDYIVAWEGGPLPVEDYYNKDSFGFRRYEADGTPKDNVQSAGIRGGYRSGNYSPSLAVNVEGEFIIGYSYSSAYYDTTTYYYARYDQAGNFTGGGTPSNARTYENTRPPAIAIQGDGDVLIAHGSFDIYYNQDRPGFVQLQRFNAADKADPPVRLAVDQYHPNRVNQFGEPVRIQTNSDPQIALAADGNGIATWTRGTARTAEATGDQFEYDSDIVAVSFNAAGQLTGSVRRVNEVTEGRQAIPRVAVNADGSFVVAWQEFGAANAGVIPLAARHLNADGTPSGTVLALGSIDEAKLLAFEALGDGANGFNFIWAGNRNDTSSNIRMRTVSIVQPGTARVSANTVFVQATAGPDDIALATINGKLRVTLNSKVLGIFTARKVVLDSGAGDDRVTGSISNPAVVFAGTGNDVVRFAASNGPVTVFAGAGADSVEGSSVDDLIDGEGGNDTLRGLRGNDFLRGGDGAGRDSLYGSAGNDTLVAGLGADVLSGGTGNGDVADYSARLTSVNLSADRAANDGVTGEGDNILADVEILTAGEGNDTVTGSDYAITLRGGAGSDLLRGSSKGDNLDGESYYGEDSVYGLAGNDTLRGDITHGGIGNDKQNGEIAYGGNGNDTLTAETVYGEAGNDFLIGGSWAYGGEGADTLAGGAHLDGGAGPDTFVETGGQSGVDYSGRTTPLSLSLDGISNDGAPGEGDNILQATWIYGGSKNDHITVTAGYVPTRGYVGVYGGAGNDTITSSTSPLQAFGGTGNDDIVGGSGEDYLCGEEGADSILGKGGSDFVYGSSGNDTLRGGAGNDFLHGDAGNDLLFGDPGNDRFFSRDSAVDTVDGGLGVDSMENSDSFDILINIP